MQCSLDSGLVVVVFIVACLLWVVCLLLFYEFEDICDKIQLKSNESNMVIINMSLYKSLGVASFVTVSFMVKFGWLRGTHNSPLITTKNEANATLANE